MTADFTTIGALAGLAIAIILIIKQGGTVPCFTVPLFPLYFTIILAKSAASLMSDSSGFPL